MLYRIRMGFLLGGKKVKFNHTKGTIFKFKFVKSFTKIGRYFFLKFCPILRSEKGRRMLQINWRSYWATWLNLELQGRFVCLELLLLWIERDMRKKTTEVSVLSYWPPSYLFWRRRNTVWSCCCCFREIAPTWGGMTHALLSFDYAKTLLDLSSSCCEEIDLNVIDSLSTFLSFFWRTKNGLGRIWGEDWLGHYLKKKKRLGLGLNESGLLLNGYRAGLLLTLDWAGEIGIAEIVL